MPVLDGKKYPYTKEGMRRYRAEKKKKDNEGNLFTKLKKARKAKKIQKKDGRNPKQSNFTNDELEKKKYEGWLRDTNSDSPTSVEKFYDSRNARIELERRQKKAKKVYTDAPMRNAENKKIVKKKSSENKRRYLKKLVENQKKKEGKK